MNIVLGATGQIGSLIVDKLITYEQPVKAVVRSEEKSNDLREKGATVEIADYFDKQALKNAFQDGNTIFLLTPENPQSEDFLRDTEIILKNYHDGIKNSNIKRIVGLSSFGAKHKTGTGNLEASYMLENAFIDLNIEQIFIRPAYYYSNWIGYLDMAKSHGILPTFFPPDQKIPMIAPPDVANFVADVMVEKINPPHICEIAGPEFYSSNDIAKVFSKVLKKPITTAPIPKSEWITTLIQVGFSPSGAKNLALMTDAVVSGKTQAQYDIHHQTMSFSKYVTELLSK